MIEPTTDTDVDGVPAWFRDVTERLAPRVDRFDVGGRRLERLTWGKVGAPGLLFLHGMRASAWWWAFIAPFFAEHYHCIAFSWSGMGQSSWDDHYSMPRFLEEARAVLIGSGLLDTPERPILIGHSFGGAMAFAYGLHFPDDVSRVILLDANLKPSNPVWWPKTGEPIAKRPYAYRADAIDRFRLSPPQAITNKFIADYIAPTLLTPVLDEPSWCWSFDPMIRAHMDGPSIALPDHYPCPLVFLWGEESEVVRREVIAQWSTILPDALCIGIPAAGHHVMFDQPLALVAALRALLESA